MTEAQLERKFVARCKALGLHQRKFSSPAHRGVPDRLILHHGRAYFVELKAPGERPTKLQEHEMDQLRRTGCPCYWTDNLAETEVILDRIIFGRE